MIPTNVTGLWVVVMNPDGISNANHCFEFGDSCSLKNPLMGETVGQHGQYRLYTYTNDERVGGTSCPQGTLFLLEPTTLEEVQAAYRKERDEKAALRETMKRLLPAEQ